MGKGDQPCDEWKLNFWWWADYSVYGSRKMAVLVFNKIGFRTGNITKDKWGHFKITNRSIHQEEVTILNLCTSNERTLNFMNQNLKILKTEIDLKLLKTEIDKSQL